MFIGRWIMNQSPVEFNKRGKRPKEHDILIGQLTHFIMLACVAWYPEIISHIHPANNKFHAQDI